MAPRAPAHRPGTPPWPGIPGTTPSPAPRPAETRRRTAPDPPCTADPGAAPWCPARRRWHRATASVPSLLVPRSPAAAAPWSTVTGRPSSGVCCGLARDRPLSAQRPAYRAHRAGERRAELTEFGGQPADLGIGRPGLGRSLAAFGLVDAVVGIDHHR